MSWNPMDWLGGNDRDKVPQGPDRFEQERKKHAAEQASPTAEPESASIKERYRQRAFKQLGASNEKEFTDMDPRQRNTRITGAYADMYQSDSATNKWAGMAAYASDLVGVGIGATEVAGGIPGLPQGMDMAGIDNKKLNDLLAKGNAGVYDDLMWQHMAMQEGGIDSLRKAAKSGELPPEQLAGWEQIAKGKAALEKAKASGDKKAIAAANDEVWGGNNALLKYEQEVFLQNLVYDESPEARALFKQISPGMISPVPGGTSLINHRDKTGQGTDGTDVGDKNQRFDWISKSMAPEYRNREEKENGSMQRDMRRFSANADTGVPGMPVNTEDPLDIETPKMPDIPYLPKALRTVQEYLPDMPDLKMPELPSMKDVKRYLPWD